MTSPRHSRLLVSLLASIGLAVGLALGACGGGDDSKPRKQASTQNAAPDGISEAEVNALGLNTTQSAVEKRFGKPVDPNGRVPADVRKGQPKSLACTYYRVKGGASRDYIQFCFKQGKLASKLSLITPKK